MPTAKIAAINLDCADPIALARFWAAILGGETVVETPGFCAVNAGTLHLGAIRAEDHRPPTWPARDRPQQIHLDLTVEDLDTAEQEAIRLGATKEDHQPSPERSRVLRDPAGHPFCLRA
ncbi:VOC family protein [Amycolatopsis acidicola]|uniref:VOC family protein n=1 Tax=Amycolatopsis acidicola TaxID=2596893 RepID=A0A5N0V8T1_9PSEU|nr:VOC family protein [Amycolatopsis acidicola]KAA9162074.1 VOC family protein [Amycolatopsis acidicola]